MKFSALVLSTLGLLATQAIGNPLRARRSVEPRVPGLRAHSNLSWFQSESESYSECLAPEKEHPVRKAWRKNAGPVKVGTKGYYCTPVNAAGEVCTTAYYGKPLKQLPSWCTNDIAKYYCGPVK